MKKRTTLNEIAYHKIKEKIMRGDFIEENYTSQNQLVEELEMSRTPIVAALQRLQNEGFVKVISNQGIAIQELSIKEINDFFDARIAIETFSIRNTIDMLKENDLATLYEMVNEQKQCCENDDFFSFVQLDADFHYYLLEVEGNSLFLQTMSNISERLFYNSTCFLKKKQNMTKFIQEHIDILEALKQKNHHLAVHELEEHIRGGKISLF
ncbi:GntR family transcriptional regulator [Peribacillus sp. TH16]|uniref:GntR family transcriptional regulator n=1 Tax=unclassified Peribacillus TaxID=2675266 RepID=UPI001914C7DA|nr:MULTISPECIES: GntR family transcriptional regulator [unclassified Peribacillus]MBK5458114.1 GntR family transcriptional regulator [Peribacillus sp. TH27]MBK5482757.1 GntR family transcriptional regulator [Peribacillus sp. TH16]